MIHRYTYRQTIHTHEIYNICSIYIISNIYAHTYNIYASLKSLKALKKKRVQGASVGSCLSSEGTGSEDV